MRVALLILLLCSIVAFPAAAQPAASHERGSAEVAVWSILAEKPSSDQVSIRLANSTDRALLADIARVLGEKFQAAPTGLAYKTGDPDFISDPGIGLSFQVPVVPRTANELPIAHFVEAFAPHASSLRIVYIIQGQFAYQPRTYENADVSITVDPPDMPTGAKSSAAGKQEPIAFYGVNVIIKNPALTSVTMPKLPVGRGTREQRTPLPVLIAIAAIIGALAGLLLTVLLVRWKAEDARNRPARSRGDHDEGRRNQP